MDSHPPAISQLLKVWNAHQGPVLGVIEVPREATRAYGIIQPREMSPGLFRVVDLVEKPEPEKAPSQLGIVGRYVLTPDLFEILENTRAGRGGEIQLTDALRILNRRRPIYACTLKGHRHDIGSKVEFVKATLAYALKDPEACGPILAYARELVARHRT
jgi:UTP--glucose-1-phosphate uridylyltransferase